jgi:hypothetical protein
VLWRGYFQAVDTAADAGDDFPPLILDGGGLMRTKTGLTRPVRGGRLDDDGARRDMQRVHKLQCSLGGLYHRQ